MEPIGPARIASSSTLFMIKPTINFCYELGAMHDGAARTILKQPHFGISKAMLGSNTSFLQKSPVTSFAGSRLSSSEAASLSTNTERACGMAHQRGGGVIKITNVVKCMRFIPTYAPNGQ